LSNFKWGTTAAIIALCISILLGAAFGVNFGHIIVRALIFAVVFFGLGFGLRFILDTFFPEVLSMNDDVPAPETTEDGEHISIAMDGMGEYAVPELFSKPGESGEIGNIDNLLSGSYRSNTEDEDSSATGKRGYSDYNFSVPSDEGIDRNQESSYNNTGVIQDDPFLDIAVEKPAASKPAAVQQEAFKPAASQTPFTPSFGDDSGLGGLPDLDAMAMAFSSNFGGDLAPAASSVSPSVSSAPALNSVEEFEPDRSQYKGNKPQTLDGNFDAQSLAQGIRTILSKS